MREDKDAEEQQPMCAGVLGAGFALRAVSVPAEFTLHPHAQGLRVLRGSRHARLHIAENL